MITVRQIFEKDKQQFFDLIDNVETNLKQKDWWLPFSQEAKNDVFNLRTTYLLGIFDNDILIGASALFLDVSGFDYIVDNIDVEDYRKIGKIGRCMIAPKYRGNNYMYQINSKLVEVAKSLGYKKMVAIAHPDNIASNKSLSKLGLKPVREINVHGFKRNLFFMDIK